MNPDNSSTDKNLWLAIALSVAVYAVWYGVFDKKVNPPKPPAPALGTYRPSAAPAKAAAGASPAAEAAPASAGAPADPKAVLAASEDVELGDAHAKVSPRGAALSSYLYNDPVGRVELVPDPANGFFSTWPELEFKRDPSVKNGVAYAAKSAEGLKITKEFMPGQGNVLPHLRITVVNATRAPLTVAPWTITVGPGLGTAESQLKDNAKVTRVVGLTPPSEGLKGKIEVLKTVGAHPGPYRWVAVDNRYFLAALVPSPELFEPVQTTGPAALSVTAKPVTLKAGGSFAWEIPYFLGAKGAGALAAYNLGLERAIDFGFFAPIGRAMFLALVWLHAHVDNWGWSVILLTLGLQTIMLPLTYKSLSAAAAMRKLQPKIAKLQERYKDDPTRLNTEMMALYKSGGANPLGGCLPMVLQMPIFIALYNALRNSWELHGSGWIWWIRDLSAKDPYYVLPIINGGFMFLQSKLNPPAGDPAQAQMMQFMPLVFTFMFLNFPSGLVLYWLTNSLVSTLLQLSLKKRFEAAA